MTPRKTVPKDSRPARPTMRRPIGGIRTGGRSARVVRAVLDATVEELARVGYGALRVDEVAARAGVSKTTVYRRWPTKAALVGDALRAIAGVGEPLPDTGDLAEDLFELLQRTLAFASTPIGQAIVRFVVLEGGDPEVDALARSLREASAERRAHVIARAIERRDLPRDTPVRLVVDAIFMPVLQRKIRYGETYDDATLRALIDLVLRGARAGGRARRK